MPDTILLLSALLTGLAGAGHCAGMCGGIAGALAHAIPPGRNSTSLTATFSAGRLLTYTLLGALAGAMAALVTPGGFGLALAMGRGLAGLLMLAIGLHLLRIGRWLIVLESVGQTLWRRISPLAKRFVPVDSYPRAVAIGALWGMLPCGLVYGALLLAATAGNALNGATTMLAFGFGTLPAVLGLGVAARWLALNAKSVRNGSGIFVLVFGTWTLLSTALALPAILDGTCRSPGDVFRYAVSLLT